MARSKIKWDVQGFEAVRRLPAVDRTLQTAVNEVAEQLPDLGDGDHYDGGVESGQSRSRGYVVTTSGEAIDAEAESHHLLRALAGVRV